jgi:transposase
MKRKQYSPDFKKQVVKEAVEVGNASIVARRHNLSEGMVSRWIRQLNGSKNPISMTSIRMQQNTIDSKSALAENEKLKRIIGEKELEIEILRDLLKKTNPSLRIK